MWITSLPFTPQMCFGWGLWAFLSWWPPSAMGGSFNLLWYHWGCLNNSIFFNLGLCAACWAHFMRQHKLWPTSMSCSFSFLNSCLGLAGGKHYQKINIPIFKILLFHATFLIFFSIAIFSFYFLQVGFSLQYVALFQSGKFIKWVPSLFCVCFY